MIAYKDFYRIPNKDMIDVKFCYEEEIDVIEKEDRWSLVMLTEEQYRELIAAEVKVIRA